MLSNMPVEFEISDAEITYAESILLKQEQHFDAEQIAFIKAFQTLDLHAVPGSGKTTALLAKLLILEKHLPFMDGSGILVISHTNAAVDEIRSKIGSLCPRLFSYPNFIGTIQSFIDKFLCYPYYAYLFRRKVARIDDTIYERIVSEYYKYYPTNFTTQESKNSKYFLRSKDLFSTYRLSLVDSTWVPSNEGMLLECDKPRGNTKPENYRDWKKEEKERIREWLIQFKLEIMRKGILCFDDAYLLSQTYLDNFPETSTILNKRFKYIFVDEMQDIDKKQHDLLEILFYQEDNESIYQRIGDNNQAIFNGKIEFDEIWSHRTNTLSLRVSHRLNPLIASIVEPFALQPIDIQGIGKNMDGSAIAIKPHIIVYETTNIANVIPTFAALIKAFQDDGKIPRDNNAMYPFKAIGWRKKNDSGKISLPTYCPAFALTSQNNHGDYEYFESYLDMNVKREDTLKIVSERIMDALLKVMRLENIMDEKGRTFTSRTLHLHLSNRSDDSYEEFRLQLYQWSIAILRQRVDSALSSIRIYIPKLLSYFRKTISASSIFVNNSSPINSGTRDIARDITGNIVVHDGITIEVNTVHKVKGQTHTATLYLETFYQKGNANFESQRLSNQFKGIQFAQDSARYAKESARMIYVGFSRPTHLLCFAVEKNRFESKLSDLSTDIWTIVEAN